MMDVQDQRVFAWLSANLLCIAGKSDAQRITFVESTWRNWLKDAKWCEALVNRVFAHAPNGTISRRQIRDLAKSANTADDFRVLFALALVWGRGKSNGRMKTHLISILSSSKLDEVLGDSMNSLRRNGPASAYRTWVDSGMSGIGPAFFTKWLWAAGCSDPTGNQALVLDSRVWASLGALDWNSIEAAGTRGRADRYGAYVRSCEQWSEAISGVSAEDVEWALFDWNGGKNKKSNLKFT